MTQDELIEKEMQAYLFRRESTRYALSESLKGLFLSAAYGNQYWTYAKLCRVEYFALLQLAAFHGFACERDLKNNP